MLIIALFAVLLSVGVIYLFVRISREQTRIVYSTSTLLSYIRDLNREYTFDFTVQGNYTYHECLPSKYKFDKYDLADLLNANILADTTLVHAASAVQRNRVLYPQYCADVGTLKSEITTEEAKRLRVPLKRYQYIERKLFMKQKVEPVTQSTVTCIATYSSPQGRNRYVKNAVFSIDEIPLRYERLQQKIKYQTSDEMRKKRARSQMTDKLRYQILKRDGFRCKLCGRSAEDGVKLHVDHIIPVSKGGETVPSNLRTLCETCNWGKGDEIE